MIQVLRELDLERISEPNHWSLLLQLIEDRSQSRLRHVIDYSITCGLLSTVAKVAKFKAHKASKADQRLLQTSLSYS